MTETPIRILIAALGGEGGGVFMNWIVAAARNAGYQAQATSVPGVAQRTGSTSYYIEIAPTQDTIMSLVPLPGRVDVVISSELVETARVMERGYISPRQTTLISSTARFYATAEKINMGDGRYCVENIEKAAERLAKTHYLLDLSQIAADHKTFVSATMFGALAGSGVLPWEVAHSKSILGDERSKAGFQAAADMVETLQQSPNKEKSFLQGGVLAQQDPSRSHLPQSLTNIIHHGHERLIEYQDAEYGALYHERTEKLIAGADLTDHRIVHALTEACRRLALWMAYEDMARVADLKTKKERFDDIRKEVRLEPGQILTVTDYMKPRLEEIADILPFWLGERLMERAKKGKSLPFLGKGRHIKSNGIIGFTLLRLVAALKHIRRGSLRYKEEQDAIEEWLGAMRIALSTSPEFAGGLAELPRVLKGYSDTLVRGKKAYTKIMTHIVRQAISTGDAGRAAQQLRAAIAAALADDKHIKLDTVLAGQSKEVAHA